MNRRDILAGIPATIIGMSGLSALAASKENNNPPIKKNPTSGVAPTPPMGWNSFDAYDCRINEKEFKAVVDFLATNLKPFGWEYASMDYCWFNPEPGNWNNPKRRFGHPDVRMDENGIPLDRLEIDKNARLMPSPVRFPSAANGKGFKPLADYVHSKGMKFGLHIMRGIPRQAYYDNLPIKGTNYKVKDIAEPWDTCNWCNNMFGVDPTKPGAQAYYDSLFELYASWGVDLIKADDTMYPPYHKGEIEMMRKALDKCGRPMVLSLSCGEAPISQAEHLKVNANMWRISEDFWDDWEDLNHSFDLLNAWTPHRKENRWPDADMIPFGKLAINNRPKGLERMSKFTEDEHYTLMSLWCIGRSPLMWGGDPLQTPMQTIRTFLQNKEIIAINQYSKDNRQVVSTKTHRIWIATDTKSADKYVAIFNTSEKSEKIDFQLELEYMRKKYKVRDLWEHTDLGVIEKVLSAEVPSHGAKVFRLTEV